MNTYTSITILNRILVKPRYHLLLFLIFLIPHIFKSLLLEPIWPLNPMYGIPMHSSGHRIHKNGRQRNPWSNELPLKVMGIQTASYIGRILDVVFEMRNR